MATGSSKSSGGVGLRHWPLQKLLGSFMSIQALSNGTLSCHSVICCVQYALALAEKKSGNAVRPGHTLPMNTPPVVFLMNTFWSRPSSKAGYEPGVWEELMAGSKMGT